MVDSFSFGCFLSTAGHRLVGSCVGILTCQIISFSIYFYIFFFISVSGFGIQSSNARCISFFIHFLRTPRNRTDLLSNIPQQMQHLNHALHLLQCCANFLVPVAVVELLDSPCFGEGWFVLSPCTCSTRTHYTSCCSR